MELLPFEFARKHHLLWDRDAGSVCLTKNAPMEAVLEIQRVQGKAPRFGIETVAVNRRRAGRRYRARLGRSLHLEDRRMTGGRVSGFTLVEVLVALMVVAIVYAGVVAAISSFVDQRLLLVKRHTSHGSPGTR